ncbi:multiheme c-type cytochrome [Candidatus Moduliflexota bacterium]
MKGKNRARRTLTFVVFLAASFLPAGGVNAAEAKLSEATEDCLACHGEVTPGIVSDWRRSRHSRVSLTEALEKEPLSRRVSLPAAPEEGAGIVVGCAECHLRNAADHPDTFEHNGYNVHIVVSPADCDDCHPREREQYGENLMANAYGNLKHNQLFGSLVHAVNGPQRFDGEAILQEPSDELTDADSCYSCHGTVVGVKGLRSRDTAMGEMKFPVLTGWPNQGVGRINPDGTKGACTACHTRHQFSIEMARKPYTCSQCHKGPDVPAYPVYLVSKHGNIFSALHKEWDFGAVPWTVGKDFTAPTCAACHVSLLTTEGGDVVAERSHRMNDRLSYRIFGPVYATAHPVSPDTTIIRNKAGLPLPAELTGEPASTYLIDEAEMASRRDRMQDVCLGCHSGQWAKGFFERLERTIETTNDTTRTATQLVVAAWDQGLAKGPGQGDSPFNEAIERMWVAQWLFYANSTRFASAMGGADYGVFDNGRWWLSYNIQKMKDWLDFKRGGQQEGKGKE